MYTQKLTTIYQRNKSISKKKTVDIFVNLYKSRCKSSTLYLLSIEIQIAWQWMIFSPEVHSNDLPCSAQNYGDYFLRFPYMFNESLEASRLDVIISVSLWNLTGITLNTGPAVVRAMVWRRKGDKVYLLIQRWSSLSMHACFTGLNEIIVHPFKHQIRQIKGLACRISKLYNSRKTNQEVLIKAIW